jgi:membrane-bound lytic murein transglycosylase D
MPYDKFMKLNPGFNRASTSPDGPHRLLVPIDKAAQFKTSLAQLPFDQRLDQTQLVREEEERTRHEEERLARADQQRERKERRREENVVAVNYRSRSSQTIPGKYKVKSGETLTAIAARNNTSVQALLKANPSTGKSVRSGVVLKIPGTQKAEPIQWTAKAPRNNKSDRIQVASSKSSKLDKNKSFLKVAVLDKKSMIKADDKNASLSTRLAVANKQNYRKASVAIAKANTDIKTRSGKKLKRT